MLVDALKALMEQPLLSVGNVLKKLYFLMRECVLVLIELD